MSSPDDPMPLHAAMLFDRSGRLRMQFSGAKAAESLTGLVTNDVLSLRGGDGQYACALTPKGRIIADVRIFALPAGDGVVQTLLVDANAASGVGFAAMIRKYVNPRLAKYVDVTATTACCTLVGGGASAVLAHVFTDGDALRPLLDASAAMFSHRDLQLNGMQVRVARVPDCGEIAAFDLFCDREYLAALRDALVGAGAALQRDAEWHRLRVMAGRPEWGADMDEGTLAQEANMDALNAISYKKGCYTGQETVARVHFRGHVNRTLRRVHFADGMLPPAVGTPLIGAEGTAVGDARSTARDASGHAIGIAMLRREVGDAAELTFADDTGAAHRVVVVGAAAD
jgi:tRNA-modifying protein YgfZ